MAKFNFGGVMEEVITDEEFPLQQAREVLKDEIVAVLGYGVQGPGQALNMRDNGINVIVGQRENSASWDRAVADGFVPGKTLFPLVEAAQKATIIQYLLSDAGQMAAWPQIKECLADGNTLYFSHGFSIVYHDQTAVIIALGIAIGSGYLFRTTFAKEVHSDLTGERGVLMGCLAGVMEAQYNILRKNGHGPSEAFNETVEELTQSLIRLVAENGMDWMFASCSTTAQRGALDWAPRFRDAVAPVFDELYAKVISGEETKRVLEANSAPDYREKLEKELKVIKESEMWQTGTVVRSLRPENRKK
jgi:ketol-acid reductoisomerase